MMKKIKAFIFAAGLGTRLLPLTANRPKALVLYQGKTLLEHAIQQIVDAGIHDVVVNVHHFADQIVEFVRHYQGPARIRISDERAYLRDTAGGLRFALPLLDDADTILLYNVDILTTLDLKSLIDFHLESHSDATLAVRHRDTQRYLVFDESSMQLVGWRNRKTGETKGEFAGHRTTDLAFSGIHVVEKELIRRIPSVEKRSLTPFYLEVVNNCQIKGFVHDCDEWMDVGKYSDFANILE